MIDLKQFIREWTTLCERFGRQQSDSVMQRYYEYLTERLTTEQFLLAAKECFADEEFFPSPRKILEKVRPSPEETALAEWERVMQAASSGGRFVLLSDAGDRALRSIGGLSGVGYADTYSQLPHLRRNFLEAFKACAAAEAKESAANLLHSGNQSDRLMGGSN